VALWREGLLARAVLKGATRGYRHHPQLERFRSHAVPRAAINTYLRIVAAEAAARGYSFDLRKIGPRRRGLKLTTTRGQLRYEWRHLLRKLAGRNPRLYRRWRRERAPEPHPLFRVVRGEIEPWERRRRQAPGLKGRKPAL